MGLQDCLAAIDLIEQNLVFRLHGTLDREGTRPPGGTAELPPEGRTRPGPPYPSGLCN